MALINARNNLGQFPVGSVVGYDFGAPADTRWLETDGSAISTTTYSDLFELVGYSEEGTGNLTDKDSLDGSAASETTYSVRWHPSSNYVACCGYVTSKEILVASFDGTTLTEVETISTGTRCNDLDWSPDGDFLAVNYGVTTSLKVFSWNGTNTLAEVESLTQAEVGFAVAWHPDGDFLAATHEQGGSDEISVYSWNGSDTLTQVETIDLSVSYTPRYCRWSPDGDYLAVVTAGVNDHNLLVYSWNGSDTLTLVDNFGSSNYPMQVSWHPEGNFIAYSGGRATYCVYILSFDGSTLTQRAYLSYASTYSAVIWSNGGKNIAVANEGVTGTNAKAYMYSWNETTYALTQLDVISYSIKGVKSPSFNYTNNYIAYAAVEATASPYVMLYAGTTGLTSCDYRTNFPLPTETDKLIRAT